VRGRLALGALGLLVGLYGGYLLLSRQDHDQLISAAIWLVSGVVLHDAVLAPIVLVAVAVGARTVPAGFRAAAVAGLVVLGAVTIVAIPVLGGFGERADNPSLLNRHYWVGWLVLAALVVLAIVVGSLRSRHARAPREDGYPPG
jgi:hypothetical protein